MKRAAFFFGAGISRASGKPLAPEITHAALTGQWHLHTDQNFYPGPHPNPLIGDPTTPLVQQFLRSVNDIARDYIHELSKTPTLREPHYEDLFSLAYQAARSELDYTPNLAVVEFLRRLRNATKALYIGFKGGTQGGDGLPGLAETACDFLHWVVHHELAAGMTHPLGLDVVTETAKSVDEVDIFTLNHDALIEQQCRDNGVGIEDGFGDRRGQLRVFNGWPSASREKVRLFKLHGSVNWFLYDFPGWVRQYAIPDEDPFHSCDQNGQFVHAIEGKAAFLSGTVVKEQLYGVGFFGDIFTAFREHLAEHSHLIFCGYGFGDPGINRRLHQWIHDRPGEGNKIVVLSHGTASDFFLNKGYWLQDLYQRKRLVLIDKWLQDCSVSDIAPFFDS